MQCPSPAAFVARQSQRDLHDTLQHLQSLYDDVQAQVVAHTPTSAASRRRATDPGSPALRGSACGSRLRESTHGSPLRLPPPAAAASPVRVLPTAQPQQAAQGSPPQHRRMRSSSEAMRPAAAAAAADSGSSVSPLLQPATEPLDSYQKFAGRMFEERFCPLRVGMRQPAQPSKQPGGLQAAPAQLAAQPPRQPLRALSAQHARQGEPPQPEQQPQQQVQHGLYRQPVQPAVPSPSQQVSPPAPPRQQQELQASPPRRLRAVGKPARASQEHHTPAQHPAAVSSSLTASSGSGSELSYASEEGDAVLLASPARGDGAGPADQPAEPEVCARSAAVAADEPGKAGLQRTRSPLPHLQVALQLLSSSAAASPSGAAGAHVAVLAQERTPPSDEGSSMQQEDGGEGGETASPAGLQPQRLVFHSSRPGSSEAEPLEERCDQQAASTSLSLRQEQQMVQQEVHQQQGHTASGCPDGTSLSPALGAASPRPLMAAGQAAAAEPAAESRPSTANSRAHALLRLKQRRLLQLQAEGRKEACDNLAAAGSSQPLQCLPAAAAGDAPTSLLPAAGGSLEGVPASSHSQPPEQQQQQEQEQGQQQMEQQQQERAGIAPPDRQRSSEQEQGEEVQQRAPKPFLRRRSQMVSMQKLPDYKSVRPRTSTRWEGSEGGSRPSTPGGSTASTPAGSRVSTPRVSDSAQPPQPLPASRAGSRLAGRDGSAVHAAAFGSPAWEVAEPATYVLRPSSPLRTTSRGAGAAAAAAGQAPWAANSRQAGGKCRPSAAHGEQGQTSGRAATRGGKLAPHGIARTTPFAPQHNSGGSHSGNGGAWRRQQQQPKGPRPRGNPLYDASSLLPLSLDGLVHGISADSSGFGGGSGAASTRDGGGRSSSRLHVGSTGYAPPAAAGYTLHEADGVDWAGARLTGSVESVAAAAEAVAAAPAGDCGPLDDLLHAVDRMLRQVERAID